MIMKDKNKDITLKEKSPVMYWAYIIITKSLLGFGIAALLFLIFIAFDKVMSVLYGIGPEVPLFAIIGLFITGILISCHNDK